MTLEREQISAEYSNNNGLPSRPDISPQISSLRKNPLAEPRESLLAHGIPAAAILKATPTDFFETQSEEGYQFNIENTDSVFSYLSDEEYERGKAMRGLLEQLFVDKGFDTDALYTTEVAISGMFQNLLLRTEIGRSFVFEHIKEAAASYDPSDPKMKRKKQFPIPKYRGTPEENLTIDEAIARSDDKSNTQRKYAGRGATRIFDHGFNFNSTESLAENIRNTPVVILGGGPAGLLSVRAMIELGFNRDLITVIDKSGKYGGIWNQPNVSEGSKNNPFEIVFKKTDDNRFGDVRLKPAPGPGSTVNDFLDGLIDADQKTFNLVVEKVEHHRDVPEPIKGRVLKVEPGDLEHTVTYKTEDGIQTITAPIVINALGSSRPLPPSRVGHMTTDTPEKAGGRWQKIITPEMAESLRGQTLVFIGLGNSTAEMLMQIQKFNKQGYGIDYRVLTHYPKEAVDEPTKTVRQSERDYRVYRDLSVQNLTKWEGDLPQADEAYRKAQGDSKIISDVASWSAEGNTIIVTKANGETETIDYKYLYTLIGYGQDPEFLSSMGIKVADEYLGTVARDFDGEIQKNPGALGRKRVYPGYFGIGAIAKSPTSPNDQVIPGIMHRMYDMLFTAGYRAAEFEHRRQKARYASFRSNIPALLGKLEEKV